MQVLDFEVRMNLIWKKLKFKADSYYIYLKIFIINFIIKSPFKLEQNLIN